MQAALLPLFAVIASTFQREAASSWRTGRASKVVNTVSLHFVDDFSRWHDEAIFHNYFNDQFIGLHSR